MNIDLTNINDIIASLQEADDAYFNSDKIILSDAEYDALKRAAQKLDPKHPYFVQVGASVRGGKIKLPYPMNGLDQIYEGEIENLWVKKHNLANTDIVVTDKLDGISCLLVFADKDGDGHAEFQIAYSRGNSVEGADITRHVKKLDFPKVLRDCELCVVRAELIMKDSEFRLHFENKYSSARATVAGVMNSSDGDDRLDHIDLVAYTVVASSARIPNAKIDALNSLRRSGFKIPGTVIVKGSQLNDTLLAKLIASAKENSKYELDGVVLSENIYGHSIKYKVLDQSSITKTQFKQLHIEISKWGLFKPRIEINPVKLFDTIVTFATAFNFKYIWDNKIGPGSTIEITKSGSVIPYIISSTRTTLNDADYEKWIKLQLDNAAGGTSWEWNDNYVEIVLSDPNSSTHVRFKQVLDFFESIKVDHLKEGTLMTLLQHYNWFTSPWSYEKTIEILFDLSEKEWLNIVGANGEKIYASLHRRLSNMKLETLLGSLNYCGFGFGVRRAKMLLDQVNPNAVWNLNETRIASLDGFDDKTASKIAAGLPKAKEFVDRNADYIKLVFDVKTDELAGVSVVFTGFRDSELEERVDKMGGKVSSGVSKKTSYVVAADATSSSGKAGKAKELGIKVLTVEEFKDMFNL